MWRALSASLSLFHPPILTSLLDWELKNDDFPNSICLPWNIVSSSKTKLTKKAPWWGLSFSLPILSIRDWCLVICISDHCFVGGFVYCFSFLFAFPVNLCFYILKVFQCIAVITFSDAWGQERGGTLFFPFDWRKFQDFLVGRALECPSFREWRALGLVVQDWMSACRPWASPGAQYDLSSPD